MTTTCLICTNESIRPIRCPAVVEKKECNFECCRSCVKKYLLSQSDPNPKCMSCRTQWSLEFIAENMPEDFYNREYRDYRAKLFFQREKSLLPEMQRYVAIVQSGAKIIEEHDKITSRIREMEESLRELKAKRQTMCEQYTQIKNIRKGNIAGIEKKEKKHNRFIGHCPYPECNGYIGENYNCGLCGKKACRSCRQVEHTGKECNKDDVETVKLLAKDTKGCPKCNVPITKIDGCDQMYCMNCHTAFSWQSGQVDTGRIHNPHYYQFMRERGTLPRERDDQQCGGPVSFHALTEVIKKHLNKNVENFVYDVFRNVGHIRHTVLTRYQVGNIESNFDLRLKFMLNEIDQSKFLSELKRRDKKHEKIQAIRQVLVMYCDTVDDLFHNIVRSREVSQTKDFIKQLINLQDYVNLQFSRIGDRFKNMTPKIDDNGCLVDVGKKD